MSRLLLPRYRLGDVARGLIVFILYSLTARLGLLLDAVSGFATLVWPPTGIALFALYWYGFRIWPAIFAGALLVNALAGASLPIATGIGIGNTLEAVVGTLLLRRANFNPSLARVRDVLALVTLAALASTFVSTAIGVASLFLGGYISAAELPVTARAWWLGDILGNLVVAPLLFAWKTNARTFFQRGRRLESIVLLVTLVGWAAFVVGDPMPGVGPSPFSRPYMLFPVLIWAALRFKQFGAVSSTFLVAAIAIVAMALRRGPFARETLSESLLWGQVFMGVSSITILLLAAAVSERDRAVGAAEQSSKASRFLAEASQSLASSLDIDTTLQSVAHLAVPALGDNCVIDMVGEDGSVRRVAEASSDVREEELLRQLRNHPTAAPREGPVTEVLRTGKTLVIPNFDQRALEEDSVVDEHTKLAQRIALRSSVTVPLVVRGKTIGAITFGMSDSGRSYLERDLALADELAHRAALALDSARLYNEANVAIHARDVFLSVASHELKTPLTALSLQVESLEIAKESGPIPAARLESKIRTIGRQVRRLSGLVDSLLDVSRLMAGRFPLQLEAVDISAVVLDVVARSREQLTQAGCELVLEVDGPCVAQWDRLRLEQIVTNLLGNAVKYGHGKPIEVRLKRSAENALLTVKDDGIGISTEDQARIFERFERAVSTKNFGGLGLGLWIVAQIVSAFDGTISVTSELGHGAEFKVILPLRPHEQLNGAT